jgi:hypothetical protein
LRSNPSGTSDSFMWGSYPASLRNFVGFTQVHLFVWNNSRKGSHKRLIVNVGHYTGLARRNKKQTNIPTNKQTRCSFSFHFSILFNAYSNLSNKWFVKKYNIIWYKTVYTKNHTFAKHFMNFSYGIISKRQSWLCSLHKCLMIKR